MFSCLDPHTRTPAQTGDTNTHLAVHLPLIVPDGCSFRVGNDARAWEYGKAWVFDDSIEHEARNDSDQARVVLIFDVWNPFLTDGERELVATAMNEVSNFYRAGREPSPR
jgi:aspartyl/asparaginyl beta-hydroxylase (cupin superfamily)